MESDVKFSLDIGFAHFDIFENYLIATINEGVVFDTPHLKKFQTVFEKYYPNKPFGYISDRKNDYTINPTCYIEATSFPPKIVGMATLCYSEISYKNATFAERFLVWPHKAYYTMEECQKWITEMLEKHKKADL